MVSRIDAMDRINFTAKALIESGHPLPMKVGTICENEWMELLIVDIPEIKQ